MDQETKRKAEDEGIVWTAEASVDTLVISYGSTPVARVDGPIRRAERKRLAAVRPTPRPAADRDEGI